MLVPGSERTLGLARNIMPVPPVQAPPFRKLRDGSFQGREVDADKFASWHPALIGAPLNSAGNLIRDKPRNGETMAPIAVERPAGATSRPQPKIKNRSVDDVKTLTALGRAALARESGGSGGSKTLQRRTSQLYRDSQVWKMAFQCRGTDTMCDEQEAKANGCTCALRVVYSATVQQVADGVVRIVVTGCAHRDGGSLHSSTIKWDPERRRRDTQQAPVVLAAANRAANVASTELFDLRAQLVGAQRDQVKRQTTPAAVPEASSPPAVLVTPCTAAAAQSDDVGSLRSDVEKKRRAVGKLKRKTWASHSKACRKKILELLSTGLDPGPPVQEERNDHQHRVCCVLSLIAVDY